MNCILKIITLNDWGGGRVCTFPPCIATVCVMIRTR